MMYGLKMPKSFACTGIDCDDAVAEQIAAMPIGTIKIIGGRSGGKVSNSAFSVDRYFAPGIGSSNILVSIFGPGFITIFSRVQYCIKYPFLFSGIYTILIYSFLPIFTLLTVFG